MKQETQKISGACATPLVGYLKALGVLRLLTQSGHSVLASWRQGYYAVQSSLDTQSILAFFLSDYKPSPIVAPWNGGSGFHPKDNDEAILAIEASTAERFSLYRQTIAAGRQALASLGLKEKPEKDAKEALLLRCRNTFSDAALEWLDSAFVLTDGGAKYPPLLGTGGNDGRLEFTNNFMQRLSEVFDLQTGEPRATARALLENSLFGTAVRGLADNPIGQFHPAASGGANASTGFDAKSLVNPWDYILALEGAIMFAAAAVKRLETLSPGYLVYPFCVQPSGAGYGSAALADENESRCEIWMPLWSNPSSYAEVKALMGEGRAWVGRRAAKDGVDFARSIASLGVDRGISEFQRYGFHVRNGLAYFATPLQRFRVRRDPVTSDLLSDCDAWLQQFTNKAKGETAPGSVRRAAVRLENAILKRAASAQADNSDTACELLTALGGCERALATCSKKWLEESYLRPLPPLRWEWVAAANDGSPEYRLAAALASVYGRFERAYVPFRCHLEPVSVVTGEKEWVKWDEKPNNEAVWNEGSIVTALCEVMKRRILLAKSASEESWADRAKITASPSDIAAFIEGRVDEHRLSDLLWGLGMIGFSDMPANPPPRHQQEDEETPPAFYAQLKLCFTSRLPEDKKVPVEASIFYLAVSGEGARASRQALRRLHGSSIPVLHVEIPLSGEAAKRCAAALMFPLWDRQLEQVCKSIAPNL